MIMPLGTASRYTSYPFPYLYGVGYGYGGRVVPRQTAPEPHPARTEVRDTVSLSPAAQLIMDQADRLSKMTTEKE